MAKAPKQGKAQSTAQIVVDLVTGELMPPSGFSFTKAREMRRDPTINLCRRYSAAPIIAAAWTAEGDPVQAEFLDAQFQPIRNSLLRTCLNSEFDFGWKAYELVYGLSDFTFADGHVERLQMIQRVKPLWNDSTKARYDKDSGEFIGVSTVDRYTGVKLLIDAEHTLFINFDDEGLGNYAEPTMRILETPYDNWNEANDAAARYDKKMAGTFLVVEFPVGKTPYAKNGGEETDNYEIASDAANALTTNGKLIIPKDFKEIDPNLPPELNQWKFYFLEPQAKQGSFVERQKYLDALKLRASALPERALIEGEFGTKAEASVHSSAALLIRQQHHEDITELLNLGPVNLLLQQNWNTTGTAWLKAMPLSEDQNQFFTDFLKALVADPVAGPDIKQKMDVEAMLETAGIPLLSEETHSRVQPVAEDQAVAASAKPSQTLTINVS